MFPGLDGEERAVELHAPAVELRLAPVAGMGGQRVVEAVRHALLVAIRRLRALDETADLAVALLQRGTFQQGEQQHIPIDVVPRKPPVEHRNPLLGITVVHPVLRGKFPFRTLDRPERDLLGDDAARKRRLHVGL